MPMVCFNHPPRSATPATLEVMGRPFCDSCARTLKLNVPALKPRAATLEDELAEHARAAFRIEKRS